MIKMVNTNTNTNKNFSNDEKLTSTDLFGEVDLTALTTNDAKISFSELFDEINFDQNFLRQRGLDHLATSPEIQQNLTNTLQHAELQLNQQITMNKILSGEISGVVRSKQSSEKINALCDYISTQNDAINYIAEIDLGIDLTKKLEFNKNTEGIYDLTHVSFDLEADKYSQAILNCAINYEAKRIVINTRNDVFTPGEANFSLEQFRVQNALDWVVIFIKSDNLYDALFLADIETVYSAILISALQQGTTELISIYNEIKNCDIAINVNLIKSILKDKRRSIWFPHHANYDVNKLNALYKYARGKRKTINVIKNYSTKFLTFYNTQNEIFEIKIGNITPGFRFFSESNTRFSFMGVFRICLAPIQERSQSLVYGTDTMLLAVAGQMKASLKELSKNLEYEKLELQEEKIFDVHDSEPIFTNDSYTITEKLRYNILDVLATIACYKKLSYHFDLTEIAKLLEFDITKDKRPFLTKIYSAASISKFILLNYYASRTKLDIDTIISNFNKEREFFLNYLQTYLGGATDSYVAKKVVSDEITPAQIKQSYEYFLKTGQFDDIAQKLHIIMYNDFRSEYPHALWLSNADKKFFLTAKGELHNYLESDKEQISADLYTCVKTILKNPLATISKNFFEKLDGNATITTDIPIEFRRKPVKQPKRLVINELPDDVQQYIRNKLLAPNKKTNKTIHVSDLPKKIRKKLGLKIFTEFNVDSITDTILPAGSTITAHLCDIAYGLINYCLQHDKPLSRVIKKITWIKAERLNLGSVAEYGTDLFTKLYLLRIEKEESLGKHHSVPQLIKYVLNTSYGDSVEGNTRDYDGILNNPAIGSTTTAIARFLTKYAKLAHKLTGGLPCYNDTDSVIAKNTLQGHITVMNIFNDTIVLEPEKDVMFDKIGSNILQHITEGYFMGKKKYGLRFWNGEKYEIYCKIHGIGQKATEKTKPLYQHIYQLLFNNVPPEMIVNSLLPEWEYWSKLSYKKDSHVKIKTIKKLLKTDNIVEELKIPLNHAPLTVEEQRITIDDKYSDVVDYLHGRTHDIDEKRLENYFTALEYIEQDVSDISNNFVDIYIYRSNNKYLVTNLKKLEKGSFGDYFKINNITFAFFCPIGDFNTFITKIITTQTTLPPIVTTKRSKNTDEWDDVLTVYQTRNAFKRHDVFLDYLEPLALEEQQTQHISRQKRKLRNNPQANFTQFFPRFKFRVPTLHYKKFTELATHLSLSIPARNDSRKAWTNFFESLNERLIEQGCIDYSTLCVFIDKTFNTTLAVTDAMTTTEQYLEFIATLPKVREKLLNLTRFNIKRYALTIKRKTASYYVLEPIKYLDTVTDKIISIRTDFNRKINVDGWTIYASVTLPKLEFTTELLARQTHYYSQAIENFAAIFTRAYYEQKHKNNQELLQKKLQDMNDKKLSDLPISKEHTHVVVPFLIRQVFDDSITEIAEEELLMSLHEQEIATLQHKYTKTYTETTTDIDDRHEGIKTNYIYTKDKRFKITRTTTIKARKTSANTTYPVLHTAIEEETQVLVPFMKNDKIYYYVKEQKRFQDKMNNIRKKAFWKGTWMNRSFCFQLISKNTDPLKVNATLRIQILVGNKNQYKNVLSAQLRVNPTQRNMYNLDLFKTTINELNDNSFIIKKLMLNAINKYSHDQKLRFFSNKASVSEEDIKLNPRYLLQSSYLLICFNNIKQRLTHLRHKIEGLAITENIETKLDQKTLLLFEQELYKLSSSIQQSHIFLDTDARKIAYKIRRLKMHKHSDSDGFTMNNRESYVALSTYIKNRRQYINKQVRVVERSQNNQALVKAVNNALNKKFTKNILRIELTIFRYAEILKDNYYAIFDEYLEAIKLMLDEYDKLLEKQETAVVITAFQRFNSNLRKYLEKPLSKLASFHIPEDVRKLLDPD